MRGFVSRRKIVFVTRTVPSEITFVPTAGKPPTVPLPPPDSSAGCCP
jgi:hypothetical protein